MGVSRRVHISLSNVFGLYSVRMTEDEEFLMHVVFLVAAIYHILLYLAAFIYRIVTAAV